MLGRQIFTHLCETVPCDLPSKPWGVPIIPGLFCPYTRSLLPLIQVSFDAFAYLRHAYLYIFLYRYTRRRFVQRDLLFTWPVISLTSWAVLFMGLGGLFFPKKSQRLESLCRPHPILWVLWICAFSAWKWTEIWSIAYFCVVICMYVCTIFVYLRHHICVCTCAHTYVYTYINIILYLWVHISLCMYVYTYTFLFACMHCICVCKCTHTYSGGEEKKCVRGVPSALPLSLTPPSPRPSPLSPLFTLSLPSLPSLPSLSAATAAQL